MNIPKQKQTQKYREKTLFGSGERGMGKGKIGAED